MKIYKVMNIIVCLMVVVACASVRTKPVSFVIEPKTPDEQAIVQMLEAMINAYNDRNIDKHVAFFSPEAKVESLRAGGVVSRDEYRTALLRSSQLPQLELRQTKIMLLSSDRSRIEADVYMFGSGGTNIRHIFYNLIRREGEWFIIGQQFK